MRNYKAKDVDSYVESSVREAGPRLKEIRKIINSTILKAQAKINEARMR